jgi:hypothetical protein
MSSGIEIRKAVIKNADMSEEMQAEAVDCATQVGSMPAGQRRGGCGGSAGGR